MQPRPAPTLWYATAGALLAVLLVLLGIALWPRPASTAAPTPSTTAPTPVQPSTPTPAQTPTPTPSPAQSPTPDPPATTPPVPDNLPAPILDNWDRNAEAWDGNPPPVVFKALFTNGDPGHLPTIDNYKLKKDESFSSMGSIIATYVGGEFADSWGMTAVTSPARYKLVTSKFKNLHAARFAMCGQFTEGRPACMAAAEDIFIWVTYEGPANTKSYDDALNILGPIITHYANN